MQKPVHNIIAAQKVVRTSIPRGKALTDTGTFKDHMSAIKNEDSFNTAIAPLLRNKTFQAGMNPMKFGIVQSTLEDYDPSGKIADSVSDLDEKKATRIYRMIWQRAGCSKLSPELAARHFSAYVRRPKTAMEALRQSGGAPKQYMAALQRSGITSLQGTLPEFRPQSNANDHSEYILPVMQTENAGPMKEITPSGRDSGSSPVAATGTVDESGTVSTKDGKAKDRPEKPVMNVFQTGEVFRKTIPSVTAGIPEIPLSGNGLTIVFERQTALDGLDAYEKARSGKVMANAVFVKLKMPF